MFCKSLNGKCQINVNYRVINKLIIMLIMVGLFAAETTAVDYPLTTDTKVDYDALKAGYLDVPEASKLRSFWFWQYGVATKKSITQDLEAMKAKGYGGTLIGDNGGPEGQVGPVFMSKQWKENFAHAVKEADRLGVELSLNIQSGWGDPGNPNIGPENGMKKIVSSEIHVTGPKKLQQKLPKPKFSIYYKGITVQAFKRVDAGQNKNKSTLHNWNIKSFNKQSGLREHRQNRPDSADDLVIEKDNIVDLTAKFSGDTLTWNVPEGEWTTIRYGMAATGKRNNYASAGYRGGLCYDQIHANGVKAQWNDVAQPLIDIARKNGNSLKYVHTDSWEMKLTNWTHDFMESFKRLRGYDMTPFLPVLANKIVSSRVNQVAVRWYKNRRLTNYDMDGKALVQSGHGKNIHQIEAVYTFDDHI